MRLGANLFLMMTFLNIQEAQQAIKDLADTSATLISWGLSLIGASLLSMISTSYVKPENKKIKLIYLLFFPGWIAAGTSIFFGEYIQRAKFSAVINSSKEGLLSVFGNVNYWYSFQIIWFNISLGCFVAWLISYFIWWIFKS
jgi:hypothetical protein